MYDDFGYFLLVFGVSFLLIFIFLQVAFPEHKDTFNQDCTAQHGKVTTLGDNTYCTVGDKTFKK